MFRILIKSIGINKDEITPSENLNTIVTIDSRRKFGDGEMTIEGSNSEEVKGWISSQMGMYGHSLGDETNSPIDLVAALNLGKFIEWEIIEGADILNQETPELPKGAIS